MNWDIAVVSMFFSLSSLSFQQWQDGRYTARAEMWEIILMREKLEQKHSLVEMKSF